MKVICTTVGLVALAMSFAAAAQEVDSETAPPAEAASEPQPQIEVTARDDAGKATHVAIDGREYALCSDTVQDRCISPRSAGLDWGRVELDYWPGQTASSLKEQPETEEDALEETETDASTTTETEPDAL